MINILVYSLCIKITIHYLLSNYIAFIISVIFAYITNKKWVFNDLRKKKLIRNEFTNFLGCRIFTLIVESIILYIFISLLGLNKYGVKILTNIVVIVLNYILSEFIVFQKERVEEKS
ncbi:Putative flippase GtrA (transmembrane translocase of bactoprenol-linked glucose) [Maledivibacter halophilus]|uniref:Putative flippase GtrA (Transmembrane translocase of bactoprenol-linked glucose) n=1 Tax=Maledivibacter halophilus TaxID=36842 RepID=A0A1T5MDA0_9FIRM|nr:Putative flippase GtrA (transmembrane translocase of bactoprenol-linked glucose) [Maledivibacter halophilus]